MKKSTLIATIAFAFTLLLSANANAQKFPDLDKALWMWLPPYRLQKCGQIQSDLQQTATKRT
jgi:hypothetical protein